MRSFTLADALDVAIIAVLIYGVIKLVREARAGQLIKGLLLFVVLFVLSILFNLNMVNTLIVNFLQFTFVAILIIFQPEIRKALEQMGRSNVGKSIVNAVSKERANESEAQKICINHVISALRILQKQKMGALIVFEKTTKLGEIAQTGTIIDADASPALIANIFFNKAPLHDGSMVIRDNKVYSAGCILPLTKNLDIDPGLGTRHRAGIGVSEESDAVVVILSEESGNISVAINGEIDRPPSKEDLKKKLYDSILDKPDITAKSMKNSLKFKKRGKKND